MKRGERLTAVNNRITLARRELDGSAESIILARRELDGTAEAERKAKTAKTLAYNVISLSLYIHPYIYIYIRIYTYME